ncbi:MAG: hypothetical protein ACRDDZ_11110 [Marinifilaceae bacterium]
MDLNWTKLISDLLPRQLRRVKMISLLAVMVGQIKVCHASLLLYMSKTRAVALRNYSSMSLERMIYDELGAGALIVEGDGKPIDFIVNVNEYVDEQRLHALLNKYKLAGKSYQILFSDMSWSVEFKGHVCERANASWENRFISHVCERREDVTEVKWVNHLCQRGPLIFIVPQPVTSGGSTGSQNKVNIVVDPQSTDINNYSTSVLRITYTLMGKRNGYWQSIKSATVSASLHQTDYEFDWNRLDSYWVDWYDDYKVELLSISPETDGNYVYKIKNN